MLRQSLILRLIYGICRPASYPPNKSNSRAVQEAIEYIKSNPASELDLCSVASRVKFAPSYFHKIFKAHTGKTLQKYVEELRIERAVHLLSESDMTLTEIAYECGFCSQSYFSYAFKRHTGIPPRAYSKRMLERYEK